MYLYKLWVTICILVCVMWVIRRIGCFMWKYRNSRPEMFCKKGVLKNVAKFTGRHLYQRLFFNKGTGLACNFIKKEYLAQVFYCEFHEISKNTFFYRVPQVATTLLKRNLWHRCFPVNFAKFLGTTFFTEHLRWLLLK